jgi:signal transduction histidine kinase
VRVRVILLVLAVASLIVVSFMLPLALLLRTFAADRAVSAAMIRAQFIAPLLPTLGTNQLRIAVDRANQQNPQEPVTIFLPGGEQIGATTPLNPSVRLAINGRSYTEQIPSGVVIFVAVQGLPKGTAVIRAFVPNAELRQGVTHAWLVLGAVAIGLLVLAGFVASQLARGLVRPLGHVAAVADQLAQGDLTARAPVDEDGPPEIRQVSNGLNRLAARIGDLLAHERETLADLSHRLRTPLTALRIDAESLGDDEAVYRVISDVDALTGTVNEIIAEARRPSVEHAATSCDATAVVRERAEYWRALAEDQERWMTVEIPPDALPVRVPEPDLAACIDILLENVFAHTPDGTAFSVRVSGRTAGGAWVVVSDHGPGFSGPDLTRRGQSSAGSTGLGLDIARRIAETSGGTLTLGRSPHGGGAVTIGLGPAGDLVRKPRRHGKARRLFRDEGRDANPGSVRPLLAAVSPAEWHDNGHY